MSKPSKKGTKKTPEEIAYQEKLRAEEKRQRALVKEKIYPFLIENTKSIEDAKNMLYACETAIAGAFHLKMLEEQTRLSKCEVCVLDLEKVYNNTDEFQRDRKLLEFIQHETIATGKSLMEGLKQAIEGFQREEATKRELSTLPATLLD